MIISLPNTTTRKIAQNLLRARENNSQTTGRVLTLIVVATLEDDVDHIISVTRDASHEHPARVLVLLTGAVDGHSFLDAEVRVGGHAGASEMVIMRIHGEMTQHLESVVTPLLLPDTPVVTWWPTLGPAKPSRHPLGRLAQRRITNANYCGSVDFLSRQRTTHAPGDSDMVWSQITSWRGIVASSLDQYPHEDVTAVQISGPANTPAVDIAAGWLSDSLHVPVTRITTETADERHFPISSLRLERSSGPVSIDVLDHRTVRVSVAGRPESLVAMSVRSDADCLSEELRHLDPDLAYAGALEGLTQVHKPGLNIRTVSDLEELVSTAATDFASVLRSAQHLNDDGFARVVLTGGGAGIGLLRQARNLDIDWSKVHVFFGDERNVPVTHADSNEGQARKALLNHIDIPAENIHGYGLGEKSMDQAAQDYTEAIESFAPQGFDLHLLGMGHEGHINSLFPDSAATAELDRLVVGVTDSPKPPAERATLTFPAIARAKRVWLLVAGAEKAEAAAHVAAGSPTNEWPAAGARGRMETVLYLAQDAATQLPS